MVAFNILMIILLTIIVLLGVWVLLNSGENGTSFVPTNYSELKRYIRSEIEQASTMIVSNIGLSLEDKEKQLRQREDIRTYIRNSCSGDRGPRRTTLQIVKDKMSKVVNSDNLDHFIAFGEGEADKQTMFEALLYLNDSNIRIKLRDPKANVLGLADDGFYNIVKERKIYDEFSTADMIEIYNEQYPMMDYEDKFEILAQRIFSDLYGLGVIDSLNYQKKGIEEIQIGLRGPQARAYDYRTALINEGTVNALCAKDAVDVIFQGCLMHVEPLGFKSDAEFRRVQNNLIINCNAGELTEKNPKIVTDTIDGRRIAAAIPPQADAAHAFIRKFNLADIILEHLYANKLLTDAMKWLVKSGMNIAVTGEMETGKTTLLRSLLALVKRIFSMRIIENDSFEVNGREYFPDRNVSSFKVSKELDEDAVLAYVRRTTGQVFAVGEVNDPAMASLVCKLVKIATQIFFSAHFGSTKKMIAYFKKAIISDGYTDTKLAELEAAESLNFDIHVENKRGVRYIAYINEVVVTDNKIEIVPILKGTPNGECKILNRPSAESDEKARKILEEEEYVQYDKFWTDAIGGALPLWLTQTTARTEDDDNE